MSEVWFGKGASEADFDACLSALLLLDRPRTPLLAVATVGAQPRLLLASRALFSLFDVNTPEDLAERLLKGGDPGARRLGAMSRDLDLEGAPRLERLRFFLGAERESLTFLCRRVPFAGEPVFIAAALGVSEEMLAKSRGSAESAFAQHSDPVDDPAPAPRANDLSTIAASLRARWPKGRGQRFLWQCDATFTLTEITPVLGEIVGHENADLVGRRLTEIAPDLDPSGALAAALRRRETWSGINVAWPIVDEPAAVIATLGAIPIGTGPQDFGGYRGYGVLYLDRVVAHEPKRLTREEPAAPSIDDTALPRTLSPQEQATFAALGGELREAALDPSALRKPSLASDKRQEDIARHGLDLLDRLGVGIIVARGDVPIFANRHALEMFGFADEDALHAVGGLAYLIVGPARPRSGEATGMRHRDGRTIQTSARMQTMEWDGLPAALLTLQTSSELTEAPQRAPLGLDDAGEAHELRAILETATDGVATIDLDGNVLSLNRSGEALFGCDRGTVIGRPFLSLFAADNQALAAEYFEGMRSNATKQLLNDGQEMLIKAHRGGTIPVFMTLGRMGRGRLGASVSEVEAPRFCALFRDLTHWKKAERELQTVRAEAERINTMKTECLTKLSEDARAPLTRIAGLAADISEERFGAVGGARYREIGQEIHGAVSQMLRLVDGLMDQAQAGTAPLEPPADLVDPIDANKIIRECVSLMQTQASSARVILRLSLVPGLPRLRVDASALRQIVLNLLSNAVTFNEPGGQVIVSTQIQDSGCVVLRIRDTGRGMSEADISAALDQSGEESVETTGTILSLPLTKALVESNEGTFAIRSKVEQGTLVEVAFPPKRVLPN